MTSFTLFLILSLFLGSVHGVRPQINDVQYTVVESTILGYELVLGIFEVSFDQDLYKAELDYCFPACPPFKNPECLPCNYAKPGPDCGIPVRNESFPNHTQECQCPDVGYCNEQKYSWTYLEEGIRKTNIIVGQDATFFRFYFTKPCHAIRISVKDVVGRSQFALDYDQGPLTREKLTQAALFTPGTDGIMCPRNPFYTYGTAYLSIWSLSGRSNTTVEWRTFDTSGFEDIPTEPIANFKCPDVPNAICPQPYRPIQFDSVWRLPLFFTFKVSECQLYLIHREMIWTNASTTGGNGMLFGVERNWTSAGWYYSNSIRPYVGNFCPQIGANSTRYFFTHINLDAPFFTMIVFITPYYNKIPPFRKIPLSQIVGPGAVWDLQGFIQLTCTAKAFFCAPGCSGWPLCCLDSWPVVPDQSIMPLYPTPIFLQKADPESFGSILDYNYQSVSGNDFTAHVVALEYTIGGSKTTLLPNWQTTLDKTCNITTTPMSEFMNADNESVNEYFPIHNQKVEYVCIYQDMAAVSDRIAMLTQNFSSLKGPDLFSRRYQIDELTFGEAWVGCDLNALSYLQQTTKPSQASHTKACPSNIIGTSASISADPCCNNNVAWTTCCLEREISINETVLTIPDPLNNNNCNSKCLDSLLQDYIFYSSFIEAVDGCNSAILSDPQVTRKKGIQYYVDCKTQWFGEDGIGQKCELDSECPSGHCDIINNRCVYYSYDEYQAAVDSFFTCIVDGTSASIREYIFNQYGLNKGSDYQKTFKDLLYSHFVIDNCVSDIGRSPIGTHTVWIPRATSACPACDTICFDLWCPLPIDCETARQYGRFSGTCAGNPAVSTSDEPTCEKSTRCAVDSTQQNCTNYEDSSLCVVCESPTNCRPVPGIQTEQQCSSTKACITPTGQVLTGLTQSQCQKQGRCSISCPNCTEEQCEQTGRCSDRDMQDWIMRYLRLQNINEPAAPYVPSPDGFCTFPMRYWNNPDCANGSVITSTYLPYSSHCLYTENVCPSGFSFYTYAANQTTCEQETTCSEVNKVYTELRSPKNQAECDRCSGISIPTFTWKKGIWTGGVIRPAQWITVETITENQWKETIDFSSLADLIIQAIDAPFTLQLETQLYCRLNPKRVLITSIACTCDADTTDAVCFDSGSIEIGVGQPCPNMASDIIAPPSVLSFEESSVTSVCVAVSVTTLLEAELKKPQQVVISTSFRKIVTGDSPVKNHKDSYVGKTLGDGILLQVSSEDIQFFQVCIALHNQQDYINSDGYTTFDFGYRLSDEDVRPYGIEATLEGVSLCGFVNLSYDHSLSFFPIIRTENWESSDENGLTTGAIVTYAIMLVLYAAVVFIGSFFEIQMGLADVKPIRLVGWYLLFACLIRALYFLLLLSDTAGRGHTNLLDFILIEAPTFLYFAALFTTVALWIGVTRKRASQHNSQVRIASFLFLFFALITLISVIIAWHYVAGSGKYYCNGRIYESPDDSQQQEVQVVYRIIVTIVALLTALFIVVSSFSVFNTIAKTSMKQGVFMKKVTIICGVASISLIAQCIFFGVYSMKGHFNYGYSYILIPIEIIPILIVISLIAQSKTLTTVTKRITGTMSSSGSGQQMSGVVTASVGTGEKDDI